jgi:uncharacterized protein YbaP (TraB family)
MHMQDKRLFYFSDSLYRYLEQAEGYALEIDLQEFSDTMIQRLVNQATDDYIDRRRLTKSSERKKIIDSLVSNVKNRKDKASKRQLQKLRQEKMRKAMKNKEMPTIMDAYLYGIARRQNKWLGGIEDIQDQLVLDDELGGDITAEELMASDNEVAESYESMIKIYLAKDLSGIEEYCVQSMSGDIKDQLLTKRNLKMAERMDSLSAVRSMFFAVGAAHLPGDTGVIALLRGKGFRVEPVISSNTIDPTAYLSKLNDVPWVKVTDEQKTYEVEMPGKASDIGVFNNYIRMKMYLDITNFIFFMSGSMIASQNVDFKKVVAEMVKNSDATLISKKEIDARGLKGIECVMTSNDGNFFKAQYILLGNRLFMLIAGGEGREKIESPEAKKFFQSFMANKLQPVSVPTAWSAFEIPGKGFRLNAPGSFKRNTKVEERAKGTNWRFMVYDNTDMSTGIYYMVQSRDLIPGLHLTVDSTMFNEIRESMKTVISQVTRDEQFALDGWPAYRLEGKSEAGDVAFKIFVLVRGNRAYVLYAGGPSGDEAESQLEKFISSFRLESYKQAEWTRAVAPDGTFSTTVPSSWQPYQSPGSDTVSGSETETEIHFVSYNPVDCISYEIYKEAVPKYYWAATDTAYYENLGMQWKGDEDSIVSKKWVKNGKLRGVDWTIESPGRTNIARFRYLLNGDSVYLLVSFIPRQFANDQNVERFFSDFKVVNEESTSNISKSKAELLLKDLGSVDTSIFHPALEAMRTAKFGAEDKSYLEKALLELYLDDTIYGAKQYVISAVNELADDKTVEFIRSNFASLKGKKEIAKFDLLQVLATYKTSFSYATLRDLLLNETPKEIGDRQLSYRMHDSLELVKAILPDLLKLSNNNLFAGRIIDLADDLMDSSLVSPDVLRSYQPVIFHTIDTMVSSLQTLKAGDYNIGRYTDILHLLYHYNDTVSNLLLRKFLSLDDLTLKQMAIIGLLKHGLAVGPEQIVKLASDRSHRRYFYDEMKEIAKLHLIPAVYQTQQAVAESDMYLYAADEDEPDEVVFIGARNVNFGGKMRRFYLYKISYIYETEEGGTEKQEYLGVAGSYDTDQKKIDAADDVTGLYYAEAYDKKSVDKQFKAYLAEQRGD